MLGEGLAWVVGWCLTLEYAVANIAVALSWGDYAASLLLAFGVGPAPQTAAAALWGRGLGAACVLLLSWALLAGSRESSRVNNVLVLFKVAILLLFVGLGLHCIGPQTLVHHWQPFFPNGARGTLYGSAVIFFSFIGFDAVATVAEEVRQPQRTIPRGIFASLGICALLYMAVAAVLTGAAAAPALAAQLAAGSSQPLTAVLGLFGPQAAWARPVIAIGALVAQTTALLAFQLAQARIFYAMARDGMLPAWLGRIHPRYHTPHLATWAAGGIVAAGCLLCSMDAMLDLTDIGTLFIFALTNASVPLLRRRQPQLPRPFLVPLNAWILPLLGVLACAGLMLYLPAQAWLALAGWIGLGLLVQACGQRLRRSAAAVKP